jgi:hypothetical protein
MSRYIALIVIPWLAAACGGDPAGARTDGYMNAQITRGFDVHHRGDAQHSGGTLGPGRWVRHIRSVDPRSGDWLTLSVTDRTNGWQVGTYDIEHTGFLCGQPDGGSAIFIRDDIRYIAETGTLTVTSVSDESVDGHFEFTAAAYIRNYDGCPAWIKPENPVRIDVYGQFSAVRERQCLQFGAEYDYEDCVKGNI